MSAGFSIIGLLLVLLVLLGFVGLVVFFIVRRRDPGEEGPPSRARRVGCALLVVVIVICAALVVRMVSDDRQRAIESEVYLEAGAGTGLQIFVDDRSVGIDSAEIRDDDVGYRDVGTADDDVVAIASDVLPDHELLEVTGGSTATIGVPGGVVVVRTVDVLARTTDGRLDSAVLVLLDERVGMFGEDATRVLLVRGRAGSARRIEAPTIGVTTGGTGVLDALLGRSLRPRMFIQLTVSATPPEHLADGVEPGYIVDDFVTKGGIPTPR